MPPLAVEHVARAVDHTLLDPGAGVASLTSLCQEADEHGFAAVCVYPWWVPRARALLQGDAAVCTVVSFPHGLDATAAKCEAARAAIAAGADEIDVVTAYAALFDGDPKAVGDDLSAVVDAARAERGDAVVKAIIESARLSDEEIVLACGLVAAAGADFAKTSTGHAGGATVPAVSLMRASLPPSVAVKASGGIRTAACALDMLDAGATRIGTSNALSIIAELEAHALAR
ncbi:MAG TPA: deoxyribose-phosphate aldolase [Gaiellales bacterium]|jgi:deoxyribose-phosphate aldolase|nr:deoxyribose-phosphate aldolase [Gaiellales bacterium]